MGVTDYNGEGRWSAEAIAQRYLSYCKQLGLKAQKLEPRVHTEGKRTWVYPLMERVIEGIKKGDIACMRIGVEFIEEDGKFTFGKILKSNAAKALRQRHEMIPETDKQRIVQRVTALLSRGLVPHEFREYAKLARKIGLGPLKHSLESVDKSDPYVAKFCKYLDDEA